MISKVQKATFMFLSELFKMHGVPVEFQYDEDLDVINEFRKSTQLRIKNKDTFNDVVDKYDANNKKYMSNLALFNRTPISRNPLIGNNLSLEVFCKEFNSLYDIEMRNALFGQVTFEVKILFDSSDASDIIEMLYVNKLESKQRSIKVTYDLGSEIESIEDVNYDLLFSGINGLGALNSSNLRYMDFSVTVSGLFFSQFYRRNQLLELIDVELHVFSPMTEMSVDSSTEDTLIWEKTFIN